MRFTRTSQAGASIVRTLTLLAALTVAGCGFRLQGAANLPPGLHRMHVVTDDRYSEFYRKLDDALQARGVEVVATPEAADAILTIRRDETGQRVLSVSARNVPREFEVFYTVSYDVRVDGEIRSGADDLTLTRDYTWNEAQVLGKEHEEAVLRSALADQLVRAVVTRLSYSE
ncbi:MAG: LPS assembly lipoprotein LptE [Pseudomonadota bacterium]